MNLLLSIGMFWGETMKVLFIRANPVKPDSRVEKEVASLHHYGYDVSVLGWDRNNNYPLKSEPLNDTLADVVAYRVGIKASFGSGMKNLKYLARFQVEIRRFLKKNQFDVVHACDFDTAFTAFHSIDHKKTKFVYDIFDYYADAFSIPSFMRKPVISLDRKIIDGADIDIICTEQRREQIKGSTPKKLIVIHNCPPKIIFQESNRESTENEPVRIAYFGILSASRLIKEMIGVVSEHKEYELHIGGFGVLEEYVKEAAAKYKNIVFYGTVPYQKVLEVESESDILTAIYDPAVKNHYYAAPNKFYESLMLGKPVIMAKNTGMSEIVEEYDIGATIEFSKEGIKKGLKELTDKKSVWPQMSSRMKQLYNEEYSWEEMERRLIDAYTELEVGGSHG